MSNVEADPAEVRCGSSTFNGVLHPREVPLGGPRAMRVRRTLPQRERSLIGAWCFFDHYGPHRVDTGAGMDVPPHPHTGLQTASRLFSGEIEHRDSGGVHAMVRPGELNLMTAGAGICHSEVSTAATTVLHGVQLWVALPDAHRHAARDVTHFAPPPIELAGARVLVFLGALAGTRSPVPSFTPLLGAQVDLAPAATVTFDVDPDFEHGVLVDRGPVDADGCPLQPGDLSYHAPGGRKLVLANPGAEPARVLVLGGEPFPDELVMWWNFVARSHDEIVRYRNEWQAEADRFGAVAGYPGARLPAPPLPHTTLRPRRNPSPTNREGAQ